MQMVHRKYRNHASHTTLLLLLFASNGNVLAQTRWIAKNLRAGCALMAQGVLPLLFGSDSPAAADPLMAITFDDLPAHGSLPPGETRVAVASKMIAAPRDAQVPPIYGFVNGLPIEQQPAAAVVLQAWRAAGFPLGNHTWSHMNLNEHSPAEFEADSSRNEPLLREWMQGEDWHWFRFPFLSEGDTPEKKSTVRYFLLQLCPRPSANSPRPSQTVSLGGYLFTVALARSWPARNLLQDDGAMILLQTGPDEFFIGGTALSVTISVDV